MSVATATPKSTRNTRTVAAVKEAAKVAAVQVEDITVTIANLRKQWLLADKSEADTRKLFEAADIAWQNARVIKVRVAYAAAMVTPVKGAANLLNAARILLTDESDTPAKRTAQAKSRKNTLRNYVAAGEELQVKGLATRTSEPDEEERKIVAAVFREMNKRDKDEAKAGDAGDDTLDGGNTPLKDDEPDADSLSFVDLVGHVAQMNKILDMLTAGNVVVSEQEASAMADMLNEFQLKLSAYAEGK